MKNLMHGLTSGGRKKMGSRIHKVMGYAITDLKVANYKIIDKRINLEKFQQFQESSFTKNDILNFIKNKNEYKNVKYDVHLGNFENKDDHLNTPIQSYDVIKFQPEFGLKNVLLITFPWHKDWNRYDDIIDYHEENGGCLPKIKNVWGGIYPYNGGNWINLKNKKIYTHNDFDPCFVHSYLFSNKGNNLKPYMIKEFATADKKELKNMLNPVPPPVLKAFVEFMGIFNDLDTYYELRPIIYTYWS
jgi:hypothetical protein